MKFDVKHVIWAAVLAVLWAVLGWLFGLMGEAGVYIATILMLLVSYGFFYYAFKDVKGIMDGLMVGIVYAIVFLIVAIILYYISWGTGFNPFATFNFSGWDMFGTLGFWLGLVGFLLFTMFLGWVNEQK